MQNIRYIFWPIMITLALGFLYLVSGVLAPFAISIIISYLLDPLTVKFEKIGIKRNWTVAIIVGLFSLFLVFIVAKLAPILFAQLQQFILAVPAYEAYVEKNILTKVNIYLHQANPELAGQLKAQLSNFSTKFFEYILTIIQGFFHSGMALVTIVALICFTPILVFYLLRDWPSVEKNLKNLLPLRNKELILEQFHQIDDVLSAYIRGQTIVCIILSVFYAIALGILGLNYALLIGIIAGFLAIIPYVGLLLGGVICAIVALLQFEQIHYVYLTLLIFLIGHALEAYVVAPKLIGDKVGLNPVWIIFALMAGGEIFGFWGIFFAIPVAAMIGVITRSLIRIYLASRIYSY